MFDDKFSLSALLKDEFTQDRLPGVNVSDGKRIEIFASRKSLRPGVAGVDRPGEKFTAWTKFAREDCDAWRTARTFELVVPGASVSLATAFVVTTPSDDPVFAGVVVC